MVISFRVVLGWPGRYRPWRHPGGNPHSGPGEPASSEEDEAWNLHLVLDPPALPFSGPSRRRRHRLWRRLYLEDDALLDVTFELVELMV